jgi:hypothetical protein
MKSCITVFSATVAVGLTAASATASRSLPFRIGRQPLARIAAGRRDDEVVDGASRYHSRPGKCKQIRAAAAVEPLGTPDPWPQNSDPQFEPAKLCNLNGPSATLTGSRTQRRSDVGAFDMVGNVIEFVADWGALATVGANWDVFQPGFGGDVSNMGGLPNGKIYGLPGTTLRGGSFAITRTAEGLAGARASMRSTRTARRTASAMARLPGFAVQSEAVSKGESQP